MTREGLVFAFARAYRAIGGSSAGHFAMTSLSPGNTLCRWSRTLMRLRLQVCTTDVSAATSRPAASLPKWSRFLCPNAIGRIARSPPQSVHQAPLHCGSGLLAGYATAWTGRPCATAQAPSVHSPMVRFVAAGRRVSTSFKFALRLVRNHAEPAARNVQTIDNSINCPFLAKREKELCGRVGDCRVLGDRAALSRAPRLYRARELRNGAKRESCCCHCAVIFCDWLRLLGPACVIPPKSVTFQLSGALPTVPDRPVYF